MAFIASSLLAANASSSLVVVDKEQQRLLQAAVQCNGPNVNTNCPTDRISYSCEEDKFLCCKWTNLPSDEYEILVQLSEIDLPMFGICFVDENDTTTTEEREGVKQMGGGPNKLEVNPLSISEYMSSAMALGISSLIATTLVTTFTAFLL